MWVGRVGGGKGEEVCVVGSGPAGFYTAHQLVKVSQSVTLKRVLIVFNFNIYELLFILHLISPYLFPPSLPSHICKSEEK